MAYYIRRVIIESFDTAVERVRTALAAEGFGVLTEINVRDTLRRKIDVDHPPYVILGACNPRLAYEALTLEPLVGTMLPCNVVIRDTGDGQIEVAAVDPVASMLAIDNPELARAAQRVRAKLEAVVQSLLVLVAVCPMAVH